MRRRREGRLLAAAGSVLLAGLLTLPFARTDPDGGLEAVSTFAPTTSTTAPPPPTTTTTTSAPALPPPPPPTEHVTPPPPITETVAGTGDETGQSVAPAGGTAAPPPAAVAAPEAPGDRVWAVLVAIDDYPGEENDLAYAVADSEDLAMALDSFGVPDDHVRRVYGGAATVEGTLAGVDWLVANAGPEDTAVFLYSGHVRKRSDGNEAIVTAEGGWIADWFLGGRFSGLQSRDAWMVIAGCYGGGFTELLAPNRILTAAADSQSLAYESDAYGRSYLGEYVFRRALLDGLAGAPTVQAAVDYAERQLASEHPNRQIANIDYADHTIALDGGANQTNPQPAPPPDPGTTPPPSPPPDRCLVIFRCD